MNNKTIMTIISATGAQGGGLARAILNDPNSDFGSMYRRFGINRK